jgi:glycosyltransferase involved in cell wall biosynthesis
VRCADTDAPLQPDLRSLLERVDAIPGLEVVLIRQQDAGLYDALARGLSTATDVDVCCYIGAGDYYSPHAFEIVAEVMTQTRAEWLTGLICSYNDRHHLQHARLPFAYRPRLIRAGVYGRWLPFIQQESTFWSAGLNGLLDFERLAGLRLAGDFYLWSRFATTTRLAVVRAWLAGFEVREGQLSRRHPRQYRTEFTDLAGHLAPADWLSMGLDKCLWSAPYRLTRRLAPDLITYDPLSSRYRRVRDTTRRAFRSPGGD